MKRMNKKTRQAVLGLSLLIAAELVLMAGVALNRRPPARPTLVPTIALNGADPAALAEAAYPVGGIEDDLWERQTGEALIGLADDLAFGTQDGTAYPAPDATLATDLAESDYQPQSMGSWSADDSGQGGYPAPVDAQGSSFDTNYPPPPDPPGPTATLAPTPVPPTATLTAAAATLGATATLPAAGPTATQTPPVNSPTAGAPTPTSTTAAAGLTAALVESEPVLDGVADDEAWQAAAETVIETQGGANDSAARVSVKAVYDDESIYFLLTWEDPSQSFLRNPWEKQPDGTWIQLVGPGGREDESLYAEDKLALMWPVAQQPDFTAQGCGIACHAGENPERKAYGNKYMPEEGQTADLWVWKSVRNLAQVDDLYLDATRFSADTPAAGRHGDPAAGGGYIANEEDDRPAYMPPSGGERTGAPGYILEAEKTALDDHLFEAGQRLPDVVIAPFEGDRGDIAAGWRYNEGRWTLELRRSLVTGSDVDVQFADLSAEYAFGLATFDNTQLRHAYQAGSALLRFERP